MRLFAQQKADVGVFDDGGGIILQILVHIELQKGENADLAFLGDRPAHFGGHVGGLGDILVEGLLAQRGEGDVVFGVEFEIEGGVDDDIILGHADAVGLYGGFVFEEDRGQQQRGGVLGVRAAVVLPMDEAEYV